MSSGPILPVTGRSSAIKDRDHGAVTCEQTFNFILFTAWNFDQSLTTSRPFHRTKNEGENSVFDIQDLHEESFT